jgi:glycine dehydrogenase subunit 1
MTELTGMDISNASHYDGATAAAEAANLAYHTFRGKRKKCWFPHLSILNTVKRSVPICMGLEDVLVTGDESQLNEKHELSALMEMIDNDTAVVIVQYPDFFGRINDYTKLVKKPMIMARW